ncbi:MAG TPA: hypothetical protein VEL28_03880 [Candidatus Binatia bacterium]|nr:hypothetical protein [Candidatus Binatia bacterium]
MPKHSTPQEKLLFELSGAGHGPLFKDKTELARAILPACRKVRPEAQERSVAAYLGQVLRGTRPCPEQLEAWILAAAESRAKQRGYAEVSKLRERLHQMLSSERPRKIYEFSRPRPMNARDLFAQLEAESLVADQQFIFTSRPAEFRVGSNDHAKELVRLLASRCGLLATGANSSPVNHTECLFFLPEPVSETYWQRLVGSILQLEPTLERKQIATSLMRTNEAGTLRVFSCTPALCATPVVLYLREGVITAGFALFYHDPADVSIARFDAASIDYYFDNVCFPILRFIRNNEPCPLVKSEVRFTDKFAAGQIGREKRK